MFCSIFERIFDVVEASWTQTQFCQPRTAHCESLWLFWRFFHRNLLLKFLILHINHPFSALDHNDFQFRVGTTLRTQTDLIPVSQVIEHEEYDDFTLDHDIVIMKLLFHVVEGPYIRRATLPLPSHYTAAGYEVNLHFSHWFLVILLNNFRLLLVDGAT